MAIIMYIAFIMCVYVATFKNDFKEDDLQRAIPFIIILFMLAILSALF